MMKTLEFLSHLRSLNVSLRLENGGLQVSAPKDSLTPELIQQLTARKPEILALLNGSTKNGSQSSPISKLPRDGSVAFPLSFAQQRLWFLDQLTPGSAAYNITTAVRLLGELDYSALEQSVSEIVRRHEVLRTVFADNDGAPSQVILPAVPLAISILPLTHLPREVRECEAHQISLAEAKRPFDLAKGPLLRAQLVRLDEQDHVFQITVHHTVFDGWSTAVFFQNLAALYRAFRAGEPSPLRELSVQYVDFASWQRKDIDAGRETHMAYWREQLGGNLPTLELPTDRPRREDESHGAKKVRYISPALCSALKALSQREETSLSMTLLAAFTILLRRLSGQNDILIGTPIAGRNRTEVEEMIGFFVNTIVVRAKFSESLGFRDHLSRIRRTMLEAHEHQDMPFEELVGALHPHRDLDRTPLFQVFFNHLNIHAKPVEFEGLQLESFGDFELESKFDLNLYVKEQDDSIGFVLAYDTELFDEDRISILLDQYERLLEQICEDPLRQVDQYSLLTASTNRRVPNPVDPLELRWTGSVQSKFVERAAEDPNRIAVEEQGGQLTYGELDRLSAGLGAWLRARGVGSGDVVAVYGHRSASLVAALLGILRADAAFSVMDPAYPSARLASCLRALKPKAWVQIAAAGNPPAELLSAADEMGLRQLNLPVARPALLMSELRDTLAPSNDVDADSAAYVTFTSGTTGEPKCILGTHRPLSHFIDWHACQFGLKPADRFSLLSGLAHDPLLRDVFTPLSLGATLCVPNAESMLAPGWLSGWMQQQKVSVAHLTPAMSTVLSEPAGEGASEAISSLRYVFFGGDILTSRDVARMTHVAPQAACVNFYGATETPQAMAWHRVDAQAIPMQQDDAVPCAIPIGSAIADAQILVINGEGDLAGIGELGEIHIRTPYLSRGYINDAMLTAQRFIANPFTRDSGDRLYRTGDLGRYRASGLVDFAGRADAQVKIRGYRIEPGEIEAALSKYPGVRKCVVLARPDHAGNNHLAAYVTVAEGQPFAREEMRAYLKTLLPEYMVPSALVVLDHMPLTPNGKIDRSALVSLDQGEELGRAYALPSNHGERSIAKVWTEVLGIELSRIGVSENFFDLGGHSLTATRVIARLRSVFEIDLPLRSIFLEPTIGGLAKHIRYSTLTRKYQYLQDVPRWNYLVPAQPRGTRTPLFLVAGYRHVDETLLLVSSMLTQLGADQPVYGFKPRWIDGLGGPYASIEEAAREYLSEVRALQPHGPYLLGGDCINGIVAFEMAQQLRQAGEEVALLALLDTALPNLVGTALANVWSAGRRAKHIALTLAQVARSDGRSRTDLIHQILRKKLKPPLPAMAENKPVDNPVDNYPFGRKFRRLMLDYRPTKYPGRITLLVNQKSYRLFSYMGWRKIATGGLSIRKAPGDHYTRLTSHHKELAQLLLSCIDQAQSEYVRQPNPSKVDAA